MGTATYEYIDIPAFDAGIIEYPYLLTSVNVYPNPTFENPAIQFLLTKTKNVKIDIADITCKKLFTVFDAEFSSGFHTIQICNAYSRLAAGVYFIRVYAGNISKTLKLIID